jgi:hypothetical protein
MLIMFILQWFINSKNTDLQLIIDINFIDTVITEYHISKEYK